MNDTLGNCVVLELKISIARTRSKGKVEYSEQSTGKRRSTGVVWNNEKYCTVVGGFFEAHVFQIIPPVGRNNRAHNSRLKANLYAVRVQPGRRIFSVSSCITWLSKPCPRTDRKRVHSGVATTVNPGDRRGINCPSESVSTNRILCGFRATTRVWYTSSNLIKDQNDHARPVPIIKTIARVNPPRLA